MKSLPRNRVVFAAISMAGLSFPPLASGGEATLPTRAAGQWELKTVMDEGRGPKDQTMRICIDEDMEKTTVASSMREHQANCSTYSIMKSGDVTNVKAICKYGNAEVDSHTKMSGDFKTEFNVEIRSTTVRPSRNGQSLPIKRTITQSGKYVGSDCGDLRPGQAKTGDGETVFVQ